MLGRPFGIVLLAAGLFAAGAAGTLAFLLALMTWLATSGTSPLMMFFTLAWSCTFVAAANLTWRRSRHAPPAFLAATGLLLVLLRFLFSGGFLLVPLFGVPLLFAWLVYRYLRRGYEPVAG